MPDISHLDDSGHVRMVDVGDKPGTLRRATAGAVIELGEEAMNALSTGEAPKGNVLETARIAGIMAAKKTAELIPLCHPLPLEHVEIRFEVDGTRLHVEASAAVTGRTGVEMEAMTAATVAALSVYDMLKAVSHEIAILKVRLLNKEGGRSGYWTRLPEDSATSTGRSR